MDWISCVNIPGFNLFLENLYRGIFMHLNIKIEGTGIDLYVDFSVTYPLQSISLCQNGSTEKLLLFK